MTTFFGQNFEIFKSHRVDLAAEFVVPFSSRSLALKSSLKSHQMTTLFVQNYKVFTQMMMFSLKPLFLTKRDVT